MRLIASRMTRSSLSLTTTTIKVLLVCFVGVEANSIRCGPGTFLPINQSSCSLCRPGTFQTGWGQSNCTLCGIGTYQTAYGSNNTAMCKLCLPGTYQSGQGMTFCMDCEPFNWSPPGAGKYQTGFGITTESSCTKATPTLTVQSLLNGTNCSSGAFLNEFSAAVASTVSEFLSYPIVASCSNGSCFYQDGALLGLINVTARLNATSHTAGQTVLAVQITAASPPSNV